MSYRTTLILAGLFLACCALYFGTSALRSTQERQAQEARRIHDWSPEAISALRITQLGRAAVAAARTDTGWTMTAPNETIRPFNQLWERVAKAAAELRNERTVEESARELERFGLADPLLTVTATHESGDTLKVAFGSQEPTRTYRYALLNDEIVFLAPENQYFEMNRSLPELRHQFLSHDREDPILRLEFAHIWTGESEQELLNTPALGEESEAIVLERASEDSPWLQVEPVPSPANQELVDELVKEIQFGVARNHIDNPAALTEYGLNPARARITASSASGATPVTLYFGGLDRAGEGGLFARRVGEEAVFMVDPHMMSLWPRMTDHFRERHLFTHSVTDVQKLVYEGPDGRFVLEKQGEHWAMVEPSIPDTDPQAITNFFVRLKGVQASNLSLAAEDASPLANPSIVCTVYLKDRTEPVKVQLVADPEDTSQWLVAQDTGAQGRIRADDAEALIFRADQFRSMTLFRFDQPRATAIDFVFENTGYTLEKVHDRWVVREPQGHLLQNQQDAEAILALLNPLTAVSGMAEPPLDHRSAFGFDQPILQAYIQLAAADGSGQGERLGPVIIGQPSAENSQERYAMADGKAGIFRVRQEIIHRLRDALRGIQPE